MSQTADCFLKLKSNDQTMPAVHWSHDIVLLIGRFGQEDFPDFLSRHRIASTHPVDVNPSWIVSAHWGLDRISSVTRSMDFCQTISFL